MARGMEGGSKREIFHLLIHAPNGHNALSLSEAVNQDLIPGLPHECKGLRTPLPVWAIGRDLHQEWTAKI